jgi:hypothetical protein
MDRHRLLCVPWLSLCLAAQAPRKETTESIYTDLSGKACKLLAVQEEGANSTQQCPGAGGFRLLVLDSDSRQSITVVHPDGRKSPLNFWHIVTRSFSSLGPKAEWRVARTAEEARPFALIVRVNASENPDSAAITSYLVVSKVTGEHSCVVAKIKPSANANAEARLEADSAAGKPCLKELE